MNFKLLGSAMALGVCVLAVSVWAAADPAGSPAGEVASAVSNLDGKAVFLEKKCDACHSVSSAGIKPPAGRKVSDLSGLSAKWTAESLTAYLNKATKRDGKEHPPKFRGTPVELDAIVAWLMSLAPAP